MSNTISTSAFSYIKETGAFVIDASDNKLFQFAVPQAFSFVSHKTGNAVLCVLDNTERNAENEVLAWIYKPLKSIKGFRHVTVFND